MINKFISTISTDDPLGLMVFPYLNPQSISNYLSTDKHIYTSPLIYSLAIKVFNLNTTSTPLTQYSLLLIEHFTKKYTPNPTRHSPRDTECANFINTTHGQHWIHWYNVLIQDYNDLLSTASRLSYESEQRILHSQEDHQKRLFEALSILLNLPPLPNIDKAIQRYTDYHYSHLKADLFKPIIQIPTPTPIPPLLLLTTNYFNKTLLSHAAEWGHLSLFKHLLQSGANVNRTGPSLWTALHWASALNHHTIVTLLLDNDADIDAQTQEGHTPLYLAAEQGHLAIVSTLMLRQAALNSADNQGWTPLHKALFWERTPVVRILINNGARLDAKITAGTYMGKTILDIARLKGLHAIVDVIKNGLSENGQTVTSVNKPGLDRQITPYRPIFIVPSVEISY